MEKGVRTFSSGTQGRCAACGKPITASRRGSGRRWCDEDCRMAFETEARRIGRRILSNRHRRARADNGKFDQRTLAGRRLAFLGAAAPVLGRLAGLDPAAERARLESVAADRVCLAIPHEEYEAGRLATLDRLAGAA